MDAIVKEVDDMSKASVDEFVKGGAKRRPAEGENIVFNCGHSKKELDDITKCIEADKIVATAFLSRTHQAPFETQGEMALIGDNVSVTKVRFSDPKMSKEERKAASKQLVTMKMLRKDVHEKHDKSHRCSENCALKGKSLAVTMEPHGDNVQLLLLKGMPSSEACAGQRVMAFLRKRWPLKALFLLLLC
jgi:hypothetical protein